MPFGLPCAVFASTRGHRFLIIFVYHSVTHSTDTYVDARRSSPGTLG